MTTVTAQPSTQGDSSSRPPQSDFAKFNTQDRLIWHKFQGFWWPGIFYNDFDQFNTVVLEELDRRGEKATKAKLGVHLCKKALAAQTCTNGSRTLSHSLPKAFGLSYMLEMQNAKSTVPKERINGT